MLARVSPDGRVLSVVLAQEDDELDDEVTTQGEEHAPTEAENPILPAINEVIWGSLAFLILLVGMWRFVLPMVQKTMQDRTNSIRDNLDEAERTKAEAERVLEDYQQQLNDAKNESARIIEEARQTAEQMRRDLMARAEEEVRELRERTTAEVRAAQERAVAELGAQVSGMAIELAEKVIEANLDRDAQVRLIESYINQVGSSR